MTKEEILLAHRDYLYPSVFHYYKDPLVIARGKDQYVWDADGNKYLDFFGGIVTIGVGHCNDEVNRKVHAQMDRLQHVSTVFATVERTMPYVHLVEVGDDVYPVVTRLEAERLERHLLRQCARARHSGSDHLHLRPSRLMAFVVPTG